MCDTLVGQRATPRQQLEALSLKLCTRFFLRMPGGGPRTQTTLQNFRDDIADRFKGEWERAVEYVNKSNDRFINKARGLLTFNGLILAALGTWYKQTEQISQTTQQIPQPVIIGGICAIASATIILVSHFLVTVGDLDDYKYPEKEFSAYIVEIVIKAKFIFIAAVLSLASLLIPLAAFLFRHFH
jgi:hypothetical protein